VVSALYKSLVRTHLKFSVQAWRPHFQKDIDLIEGVHRRTTKLITSLITYEERLRLLNLQTLETRRVRGDLIEVFKKMFKGFEDIDQCTFLD
jgi:ribonucleases P/MRP protein subunit RPP40